MFCQSSADLSGRAAIRSRIHRLRARRTALATAFVAMGCGSGSSQKNVERPTWPKQVVLHTTGPTGGDGVRLSDGAVVKEMGDLTFAQAMVLSLGCSAAMSCCEKGKYGTLAEVPTDEGACPAALTGQWTGRVYLSGSSTHTLEESYVIGLGVLVRDASSSALYRLRILGDAYDEQGLSTAKFEYEPIK